MKENKSGGHKANRFDCLSNYTQIFGLRDSIKNLFQTIFMLR